MCDCLCSYMLLAMWPIQQLQFFLCIIFMTVCYLEQHQWDHYLDGRERGILSLSLMHYQYISPRQCHLSRELKMACEIKACLTGSVINATLNSCTNVTAAIAALFILYCSLCLPPTSLSLCTLLGDMACASSIEPRKPKTRGILLKGVSQQPDINNLHVCRAESNPLGLCGFTWECVHESLCVSQHLLHMCSMHPYVSCLLFVPLSILDVWNDTRTANCGSIEPNL